MTGAFLTDPGRGWHSKAIMRILALLVLVAAVVMGAKPEPRCPSGAKLAGAAPPQGLEEWCETTDEAGLPMKHGLYIAWFDEKQKQAEIHYLNGKEEGRTSAWYPNGKKMAEGLYRAGQRVGIWKKYYENGKTWAETPFVAGQKHGLERRWDEEGNLKMSIEWRDGEPLNMPDEPRGA